MAKLSARPPLRIPGTDAEPGTKRRVYLADNVGAADVRLTADDIAWLDEYVGRPAGDRYADLGTVNR
jgi:aryl-alcohol dehydrogenase-like predicted oxidoreductase